MHQINLLLISKYCNAENLKFCSGFLLFVLN